MNRRQLERHLDRFLPLYARAACANSSIAVRRAALWLGFIEGGLLKVADRITTAPCRYRKRQMQLHIDGARFIFKWSHRAHGIEIVKPDRSVETILNLADAENFFRYPATFLAVA